MIPRNPLSPMQSQTLDGIMVFTTCCKTVLDNPGKVLSFIHSQLLSCANGHGATVEAMSDGNSGCNGPASLPMIQLVDLPRIPTSGGGPDSSADKTHGMVVLVPIDTPDDPSRTHPAPQCARHWRYFLDLDAIYEVDVETSPHDTREPLSRLLSAASRKWQHLFTMSAGTTEEVLNPHVVAVSIDTVPLYHHLLLEDCEAVGEGFPANKRHNSASPPFPPCQLAEAMWRDLFFSRYHDSFCGQTHQFLVQRDGRKAPTSDCEPISEFPVLPPIVCVARTGCNVQDAATEGDNEELSAPNFCFRPQGMPLFPLHPDTTTPQGARPIFPVACISERDEVVNTSDAAEVKVSLITLDFFIHALHFSQPCCPDDFAVAHFIATPPSAELCTATSPEASLPAWTITEVTRVSDRTSPHTRQFSVLNRIIHDAIADALGIEETNSAEQVSGNNIGGHIEEKLTQVLANEQVNPVLLDIFNTICVGDVAQSPGRAEPCGTGAGLGNTEVTTSKVCPPPTPSANSVFLDEQYTPATGKGAPPFSQNERHILANEQTCTPSGEGLTAATVSRWAREYKFVILRMLNSWGLRGMPVADTASDDVEEEELAAVVLATAPSGPGTSSGTLSAVDRVRVHCVLQKMRRMFEERYVRQKREKLSGGRQPDGEPVTTARDAALTFAQVLDLELAHTTTEKGTVCGANATRCLLSPPSSAALARIRSVLQRRRDVGPALTPAQFAAQLGGFDTDKMLCRTVLGVCRGPIISDIRNLLSGDGAAAAAAGVSWGSWNCGNEENPAAATSQSVRAQTVDSAELMDTAEVLHHLGLLQSPLHATEVHSTLKSNSLLSAAERLSMPPGKVCADAAALPTNTTTNSSEYPEAADTRHSRRYQTWLRDVIRDAVEGHHDDVRQLTLLLRIYEGCDTTDEKQSATNEMLTQCLLTQFWEQLADEINEEYYYYCYSDYHDGDAEDEEDACAEDSEADSADFSSSFSASTRDAGEPVNDDTKKEVGSISRDAEGPASCPSTGTAGQHATGVTGAELHESSQPTQTPSATHFRLYAPLPGTLAMRLYSLPVEQSCAAGDAPLLVTQDVLPPLLQLGVKRAACDSVTKVNDAVKPSPWVMFAMRLLADAPEWEGNTVRQPTEPTVKEQPRIPPLPAPLSWRRSHSTNRAALHFSFNYNYLVAAGYTAMQHSIERLC